MTFLNVEHFIKQTGNMKSQGIFLFIFIARTYLLFCEPPFIGKCVFEFISVQEYFIGSDDGINFRQFNLSNPGKVIPHLLFLELKLKIIWKMLPLATSANSEMAATGFNPVSRVFMKLNHSAFKIFFSFLYNPDINDIARYEHRHKYNKVIYPCQRISFG